MQVLIHGCYYVGGANTAIFSFLKTLEKAYHDCRREGIRMPRKLYKQV